MAAGLRIFNPNGTVNFDSDGRWGMIVDVFDIPAASLPTGQVPAPGSRLAKYEYASMEVFTVVQAGFPGFAAVSIPVVTISGRTVSWYWPTLYDIYFASVYYAGATVYVVIL